MALNGYDASIEFGRSALNKLLAALEHSRLWVGSFAGDTTELSPQGFLVHVNYALRLYDIRLRPHTEQEQNVITSIILSVNISGRATIDVSLEDQDLLHHQIDLDGTVSIIANLDLTFAKDVHRLVITFRNAFVQDVVLRGLPDDIQRMMVNGLEFLLQEELRHHQQDLPLTGLLNLSGSAEGRLDYLFFKTHYYRLIAHDSAVGLGIVMEPGAATAEQRDPLRLVRLADDELVLTVHQGYLNRVIANGLKESEHTMLGGQLFGDKLVQQDFHVRSVAIVVVDREIAITVRAGWQSTELSLQASLLLAIVEHQLAITVTNVECDVPTWKGVLLKLGLNVVAGALLEVANAVAKKRAEGRIAILQAYANHVAMESTIFHDFPEGFTVKAIPATVALSAGNVTLGYQVTVNPT